MHASQSSGYFSRRNLIIGLAALIVVLTILAYLPALQGPYLLDDIGNLEPLKRWLDGSLSARAVSLDNRSGAFGRPLSMVTFLFDAWRTGDMNSLTFKPTNLVIHLLCGGLTYVLVAQCLSATSMSVTRWRWYALAVATVWLWMPMQVSTVLYVIQRMAQLSTLWILATLVFYAWVRRAVDTRPTWDRIAALWVGTLVLTVVATLSKENGLLAIPLAAAMEWTIFARPGRPRAITFGFTLLLGVPALLVAGFISLHPSYMAASYAARDFTLPQRLLTEPRILWDYVTTSFLPIGSQMGIFHDNYPVSTSLLRPTATLVAIIAWLGMLCWALAWRRRAPLFALGVVGFLIAHAMEGGPIALELYFEHRNYLPSVFALLACTGLVLDVTSRVDFTPTFRRIASFALLTLVAAYGLGTWNQAAAWADADEFYAMQYSYNPTSPRLLSALTARAMAAKDLKASLTYIGEAEKYEDPSEHGTTTLWRFLAYCETESEPVPNALYDELELRARGRITSFGMNAWELLANRLDRGCPSLDAARVAKAGRTWTDATRQVPADQAVWRTRYNLGRILAASGDIAEAESTTYRAWVDSGRNNGVGAFLFQLDASLGRFDRCREVLGYLEQSYGKGNRSIDQTVDAFRKGLSEMKGTASDTTKPQ